ncbi:MAG: hypothetical protein IJL14_04185 [Selenomonadaceae bacterium]|nr:hypothetical protein [Selenomonadaceae bacterium]
MTLQERKAVVPKILAVLDGFKYNDAHFILEQAIEELSVKSVVTVQCDMPHDVLCAIRENIDTIADEVIKHLVKNLNQCYQDKKI